MNLSGNEAREALDVIEDVKRKTDRRVAGDGSFPQLLLWGSIWFIFPLLMHFRVQPHWAPFMLFPLGGIATTIIVLSKRHSVKNPANRKVAILFWVLFLFIGLLAFMLKPSTVQDGYSFGCTAAMLVYVVMGLYSERFFLFLGLLVAAFVLLGHYVFTDIYWLWMAITGGGSLLGAAFYLKFLRK